MFAHEFEESTRGNDPHSSERIKAQKILIPTDDYIGLSVNCDFKKLVVARIAAGSYRGPYNHSSHRDSISLEKLGPRRGRQVPVESRASENFFNLGNRLCRSQQYTCIFCLGYRLARGRLRCEQRTDEHVGIDDNAGQGCHHRCSKSGSRSSVKPLAFASAPARSRTRCSARIRFLCRRRCASSNSAAETTITSFPACRMRTGSCSAAFSTAAKFCSASDLVTVRTDSFYGKSRLTQPHFAELSLVFRTASNSSPVFHSIGLGCPLAIHPSTSPNRASFAFPRKSQSARYSSEG